jgi:group I intron endonuclease
MLVYLVQNRFNEKVYIGQTQKSLVHRWKGHIATARSVCAKNYLQNAIRLYGPDAFSIQPIASASTQEELDNLERVFIILFRAREKKYGYNLKAGGDVATGFHPTQTARLKMRQARLAYKQTPETIAKAAASNRGQKRSPESILKMRAAQQNRPPISDTTREKMRLAKLGKARPPRTAAHCENIRKAKLGHSVSSETRLKISESLKKRNKD